MKLLFLLGLMACTSLSAQIGVSNPKQHWKLVDVSSENVLTGELATMAFDNNPETQWHTRWHDAKGEKSEAPPHIITIDLQTVTRVVALRVRTRAHGEGGFPKDYRFETSLDGSNWDKAAEGTFQFRSRMSAHARVVATHYNQPLTQSRFVRLSIFSTYENQRSRDDGLVISEIDIETPLRRLQPTTTIPVPQSREWNYGGYDWKSRHRALKDYAQITLGRTVFIGDSITHRWGAKPYDETPQTGKAHWDQYYTGRQALNLGYGWDRVENMLWRIQHGELDHADPKLIVLMAGTNNLEVNTPSEIAEGVRQLCFLIHQTKPRAHILLLAVFPRSKDTYPAPLVELNEQIAQLDKEEFITFKDIGHVFLNDEGKLTREIMPDLLHPGEDGYRRWAKAIEADVARILGDAERH